MLSQRGLSPVFSDPHRSHISPALFNTLIILHLLGKLDFYETRSSVFEFNWNAVTSGCNMRRGTCYSIYLTMLNLWCTKALKHCVRKSWIPFVGRSSIKNLEMSIRSLSQKHDTSCMLPVKHTFYCFCAFSLFFLKHSFESNWFLCFMLAVRLINKMNWPQMSNMLPKAGEWSPLSRKKGIGKKRIVWQTICQ